MRKIRIAQIGINRDSHSRAIFNSLKKQSEIFEIVGYALVEDEAEKFSDLLDLFDGYTQLALEEILNDPTIEAVTVETEECHLTRYAALAAEHGKHIHMEKPGGISIKEFEAMIETVKKGGKVFHTGYMYRYNPYIQELLADVRAGKLGEILSVEAQMNCWHPERVRRWLGGYPGGMMFYLGCHLVDLILLLQGEPKNIIPLNCSSGLDGVESEDFGMAVLEYDHGVSFAKTTAVEKGGFLRRQLVVNGTLGTVELKPLEMYEGELLSTGRTVWTDENWHTPGKEDNMPLIDRYDTMMASFAQMVAGEKENPYSYDYELLVHKTTMACCGVKE